MLEPACGGPGAELGSGREPAPLHDMPDKSADGPGREAWVLGDLPVREPGRDRRGDVAFPWGQSSAVGGPAGLSWAMAMMVVMAPSGTASASAVGVRVRLCR